MDKQGCGGCRLLVRAALCDYSATTGNVCDASRLLEIRSIPSFVMLF